MDMSISPSAIPLLITAVLNLVIAVYVYQRGPRGRPHVALAAIGAIGALWAIGVALGHYAIPQSVFFVRFTLAVASLAPLSTLVLADVFPPERVLRRSGALQVFAVPGILFFILAMFTPLLVASVGGGPKGISVEYGPLHLAYGIYVLSCFASSIWVLALKYRAVTGSLRIQTGYLLVALSVPIAFGMLTNLLIPLLFGVSSFSK